MLPVPRTFHLDKKFVKELMSRQPRWGFGLLSQATVYRSYSRPVEGQPNETWAQITIRVVEGVMDAIANWHRLNGRRWDERYWQAIGQRMALAYYNIRMGTGRSNWHMGTDHGRALGSFPLNNCSACWVRDLEHDLGWVFDALMLGTGVGVGLDPNVRFSLFQPDAERSTTFVVPDSREGWVESARVLLRSYLGRSRPTVAFDYSRVRPRGAPIRGFGGVASGPEPLERLHGEMRGTLDQFVAGEISQTVLVADLANQIAKAVVAGNVRRSAMILLGQPGDKDFLNLKNPAMFPRRNAVPDGWAWQSNNTIILSDADDYADFHDLMPMVEGMIRNGEPGWYNQHQVTNYGRFGERRHDTATLTNPCGEICLDNYELCNLVEVFPARCRDEAEVLETIELATLFALAVTLMPTHSDVTNEVIQRNRRTGVALGGMTQLLDIHPTASIISMLRRCYRAVDEANERYAAMFGIPRSIRLTTSKPSGSLSLLAGVSPGVNRPHARRYVRRMRIDSIHPVVERLAAAGVPILPAPEDPHGTVVAEFPIEMPSARTRTIKDVSLEEQMQAAFLLARHYVDNSVSATFNIKASEVLAADGSLRETGVRRMEAVVAHYVGLLKTGTVMVDNDDLGYYEAAPYESITRDEYVRRMSAIKVPSNLWDGFTTGSLLGEASDDLYCSGDNCVVPWTATNDS